jgi:enoyl-CoA hydratase/carnithine racemase
MTYDSILYEEQGDIGILTLNMPEKRNALGIHAETELINCLQDAAKSHHTKVIILRANGSVFCAGHDRSEILNRPLAEIRRLFQTSFNLMGAIRAVPQCVIAEVHAIAMAGGCHLVAGCDLITAAKDNAKFGMTGLVYSYNCTTPTVAVSRAVGQKKCMEMLMTARLYSAEESLQMGLVNMVFPDDQLHDKTMELANDISRSSKYAIYMAKQNFYAQIEMTEQQAYMFGKEMMAQQAISANATEGFTAFIEKRDPVWNDDTF